jgi:hypothetical protein
MLHPHSLTMQGFSSFQSLSNCPVSILRNVIGARQSSKSPKTILLGVGQLSGGMKEEISHLSSAVRWIVLLHYTVHLDLSDNLAWTVIEIFKKKFHIKKDISFPLCILLIDTRPQSLINQHPL